MTTSIRNKALPCLAALLFVISVHGSAQEGGFSVAVAPSGCPDEVACPALKTGSFGAPQIGVVSMGGMRLQESVQVVKNQPYQAQAVSEIKQTLADGSHIDQTTTATVARDSDGRTVRIQKLSTMGPWKSSSDSSQASSTTLTTIFDPVANTHTDYTSDSKIAHVLPMPPKPSRGAATAGGAAGFAVFSAGSVGGPASATADPGPVTFAVQGHAESPQTAPDAKSESLGQKTIDGISATGAKTTNTIPAGTIGNDKDIVITRETWYSSDLQLVVQSSQSDPRFGETTYSLTNIQRSEPDPALFQVPAGYTVDKVPVVMQSR